MLTSFGSGKMRSNRSLLVFLTRDFKTKVHFYDYSVTKPTAENLSQEKHLSKLLLNK